MDCKKALTEAKGNMEAAVDLLRKKGVASAAKKSARATKEGVIAQNIQAGARAGVLLEINCETDFVARNDTFRAFSEEISRKLNAGASLADLEPDRIAVVARIGENIQVPRFIRYEVSGNGMVAAYIHTGAKVGVLVEVSAGKETTVAHEDFKQLVRDITLQIAAGNPSVVSQGADRGRGGRQRAGNRRRAGQEQAAPGHRENCRRQIGEVLSNLLPGGPGICQAQLGNLRQGAHRQHCQAIGR